MTTALNPANIQKCVSVIFNPVSGTSDPEDRKATISAALAEHGYTCQFIATTVEVGAKELAQKALDEGVDLLAVSGGDGTIMAALSSMIGSDIPIAVLPAGTGNLLSVNLGIPMTVPEAVDVALNGIPYQLDLARSGDDRYFAIMGGIGFDGQVIADADRESKRRLGVFAYFRAALMNLTRRQASARITLDGNRVLSRRFKTIMVANMGRMTGGFEAVPTATPNDGQLNVVVMRTETVWEWIRLLVYAFAGRANKDPAFDVYQARKVTVRTSRQQPLELDGELVGQVREWNVEVIPKAVKILVAPHSLAVQDMNSVLPAAMASARRRWALPAVAAGAAIGTAVWIAWKRSNSGSGR